MNDLPMRWSTRLVDAPLGLVWTPVRVGDEILVRVNNAAFRIDMADGTLRGRSIFDSQRSLGSFAAAAPGGMVTNVNTDGGETGYLVWIAVDGRATRRLELGYVKDAAPAAGSAELDVLVYRPGAGNHLVVVDRAAGTIVRSIELPFGASSSLRHDRGWLLSHTSPTDDGAGLYVIDERGALSGRLVAPAVDNMVASERWVATAMREPREWRVHIEVRDRGSLDLLWSNPAAATALAVDGDDLATVQGDSAGFLPALVDPETGRARWRAGSPAASRPDIAGLFGPVAVFGIVTGVVVYRRSNGELLGYFQDLSYAVLHSGDDLILCGSSKVVCFSLAGL